MGSIVCLLIVDQCGWSRDSEGRIIGHNICINFCFTLTAIGILIPLEKIT